MISRVKLEVRLKEINDLSGFQACLELQRETWGRDFSDLVPPTVLMIAQKTGGLVLGAYVDDLLVGFAWGISGLRGNHKIHWSDMLAVKKSFRDQGIGYLLKMRQRQILRRRGVQEILWTFDPLESRNAHFNFSKLGVVVREYCPNFYGFTRSPVHAVLETDRLIAIWNIQVGTTAPRTKQTMLETRRIINPCRLSKTNELISGTPDLNLHKRNRVSTTPLYFEMVSNLAELRSKNLPLARQWQQHTRTAFCHYLSKSYIITDFVREEIDSRMGYFYVFERRPVVPA